LELIGDIARKTHEAGVLAIEAEKSRLAAEIAADTGLFSVPRVVRFDPAASHLDFERVPQLTQFSELVGRGGPEAMTIAERAGRALAIVHKRLKLDATMRIPLPARWRSEGEDDVFIHGDFTANNLCIDERSGQLVIVDWSTAAYLGNVATVGPRSFDVAWFVRHLQMSPPWDQTFSWPGRAVCDALIRAYVDEYGSPLDAATWRQQQRLIKAMARWGAAYRIIGTPKRSQPIRWLGQIVRYCVWRAYRPPAECLSG
jgi:hypothetical protein